MFKHAPHDVIAIWFDPEALRPWNLEIAREICSEPLFRVRAATAEGSATYTETITYLRGDL